VALNGDRAAERVEPLLEELGRMCGPVAFQRVEELVRCLLEVYGAALERILRSASARIAPDQSGAFQSALAEDALLSSLLVLHGLHPATAEERARASLLRLAERLGAESGAIELEALSEGRLRVHLSRARGGPGGGNLAAFVRRALLEAAPELEVEIEADAPEALVQIGALRGEGGR
jgi:hypothetical protein